MPTLRSPYIRIITSIWDLSGTRLSLNSFFSPSGFLRLQEFSPRCWSPLLARSIRNKGIRLVIYLDDMAIISSSRELPSSNPWDLLSTKRSRSLFPHKRWYFGLRNTPFCQLSSTWTDLWVVTRLEATLFWYRPYCFCCVNQVVHMLTSLHLHEKSRKACIKARSPPALLAFKAR